jgi:hypothetical protein
VPSVFPVPAFAAGMALAAWGAATALRPSPVSGDAPRSEEGAYP